MIPNRPFSLSIGSCYFALSQACMLDSFLVIEEIRDDDEDDNDPPVYLIIDQSGCVKTIEWNDISRRHYGNEREMIRLIK